MFVPFEVAATGPSPGPVDEMLRSLPEWFGIEDSIREYVAAATRLPTFLARDEHGRAVGVLLYERHFRQSAEIHLMAVDRAWHRRGVGRALVGATESAVRADGAELLSVKTLGPSRPDAGYDGTRSFYLTCGFLPVEELLTLWDENPCLLMVKPLRPVEGWTA